MTTERTPAKIHFGFELGPGYSTNHVEKGSKKSIHFLEMELSAAEASLNSINTKFEEFRYRETLLSEAAGEKELLSSDVAYLALKSRKIIFILGLKTSQIFLLNFLESTSASIRWMSVLSIFVLLGTAIFQIFYFVHFLHVKKIL
jgi:hypothetical protein